MFFTNHAVYCKNVLFCADTYDATTMSGGFADGHLKCDALLEMVRVVKPGKVN